MSESGNSPQVSPEPPQAPPSQKASLAGVVSILLFALFCLVLLGQLGRALPPAFVALTILVGAPLAAIYLPLRWRAIKELPAGVRLIGLVGGIGLILFGILAAIGIFIWYGGLKWLLHWTGR